MPSRSSKRSVKAEAGDYENEEVENKVVEEEDPQSEDDIEQPQQEEDEEEEEEEVKIPKLSSSRSRKRQKRIQVMSQSGQTESERRILRQNQRNLLNQMTDSALDIADKMADVNCDTLRKIREKNNGLWEEVRFTREAVLDGENIEFISSTAARQLDQLISVSVICFLL